MRRAVERTIDPSEGDAMARKILAPVLVTVGILGLGGGALLYMRLRHERMMREHDQDDEERAQALLAQYEKHLGPLDRRNQAALPKLRDELTALSKVLGDLERAPRSCGKLEGQVGLAHPEQLKAYAAEPTKELLDNHHDTGYGAIYDRYLRQGRLDLTDPARFQIPDHFHDDVEALLKLPYLAVLQVDVYQRAVIQDGGKGYDAGRVSGRITVLDVARRQPVCRTTFSATNSDSVNYQYQAGRDRQGFTKFDEKTERSQREGMAESLRDDLKWSYHDAVKEALRALGLTVYKAPFLPSH